MLLVAALVMTRVWMVIAARGRRGGQCSAHVVPGSLAWRQPGWIGATSRRRAIVLHCLQVGRTTTTAATASVVLLLVTAAFAPTV